MFYLLYVVCVLQASIKHIMCWPDINRSEGCARTGYFIPVRDGMEAGEVWKFFRRRRRRRRRQSPKGDIYQNWNPVFYDTQQSY